MQFQQRLGNRGVTRWVTQMKKEADAQITLGMKDHPAEREADSVAERVVDKIEGGKTIAGLESIRRYPTQIRRQSGEGTPRHTTAESISSEASHRLQIARNSSGFSLPQNLQTGFRKSLGPEATQARLHHDATSHSLAQDFGADAFAFGRDVFFRDGAYQPETRAGKELIAHELTHTLQDDGEGKVVRRAGKSKKDKDKKKKKNQRPEAGILRILSYNQAKLKGQGKGAEMLLEFLEAAFADIGIIIEPSVAIRNFAKGTRKLSSRNKTKLEWKAKLIGGTGPQDQYVVVYPRGRVRIGNVRKIQDSDRDVGLFNVSKANKDTEMKDEDWDKNPSLNIATGHAPYGKGTEGEASSWLKRVQGQISKQKVPLFIGDVNTYGSGKSSSRQTSSQNYTNVQTGGTTYGQNPAPLDKAFVLPQYLPQVQQTGRVFFSNTEGQLGGLGGGEKMEDMYLNQEMFEDSDHAPIYLDYIIDKALGNDFDEEDEDLPYLSGLFDEEAISSNGNCMFAAIGRGAAVQRSAAKIRQTVGQGLPHVLQGQAFNLDYIPMSNKEVLHKLGLDSKDSKDDQQEKLMKLLQDNNRLSLEKKLKYINALLDDKKEEGENQLINRQAYIQLMAQNTVWGGPTELRAYTQQTGTQIIVINTDERQIQRYTGGALAEERQLTDDNVTHAHATYPNAIFLLMNGRHFTTLHRQADGG